MLNHITYPTQPAGTRTKVLVTTGNGVAETRTLVTLDAHVAPAVAAQLAELADNARVRVALWALDHPGEVCFERRTLMAAVLNGQPAGTHAAKLAELLIDASDAERRAVADEVGRIYDGTEDIIVPVLLTDEFGKLLFAALANDYLTGEGAEYLDELAIAIIDGTETGVLYEGVLAWLRSGDDDIDDACDTGWVDVEVPEAAFTAWLRKHHPALAAECGVEED